MRLHLSKTRLLGTLVFALLMLAGPAAMALDLQETRKTTAASAPDNSYKVTTIGAGQSVKCFNVHDPMSKKVLDGDYEVTVTFDSGNKETKTITFKAGSASYGGVPTGETVKDVDVKV